MKISSLKQKHKKRIKKELNDIYLIATQFFTEAINSGDGFSEKKYLNTKKFGKLFETVYEMGRKEQEDFYAYVLLNDAISNVAKDQS